MHYLCCMAISAYLPHAKHLQAVAERTYNSPQRGLSG
jgi:hypothetical protein